MDQDVYGAFNKQQIESLTTDGEGELLIPRIIKIKTDKCRSLYGGKIL